MAENINRWDHTVLHFIQENLRVGWLSIIMKYITILSGGFWLGLSIALLLFPDTQNSGLHSLLSLTLCFIIVHLILKPNVARKRPYEYFSDLKALIPFPKDYSFPSGHSASAFAAIGAYMGIANDPLRICLIVLAFLIAFSRLYVGVHYPSDVIVGITIGSICSYLVWLL